MIHRIIARHMSTAAAQVAPKLESLLGSGNILIGEAVRSQHGHDESHHVTQLPDLVVKPRSVEEVQGVVRLCNEFRCPVIPFGAGSGLEGGVVPHMGGVSLDLCNLDQIVEVNPEDFDCTVQAGVSRNTLNHHLHDTGLWFPIDPGADASLCGMCATGASGTNAIRYGTMRENVLNLEVVLPSGELIHSRGAGRRPKKSSAGYNITNLFVSSEGTLGVFTSATLRLSAIPDTFGAAICAFPDVQSAVDSVVQILQCSIPMARLEFMDEVQIEACNKYSKLDLAVTPSLFMEFHGSEAEVDAQAGLVGEICEGNSGGNFQWSHKKEEREVLWKARHNCYYAALALRPGSKGLMTDLCVPISKLPQVLVETKKDIDASSLPGPIVGHVGDGNFHCTFPVFPDDPQEMEEVKGLCDRMVKRALAVSGTCTGEHGVGLGKRKYMVEEFGAGTVELMKNIKKSIDPNGIMNPGKIFL